MHQISRHKYPNSESCRYRLFSYANSWTLLNLQNLLHVLEKKLKTCTRKIRVCVCKKGGRPTFMWRHEQVNCLLWKAGPNSAYLPLQICIIQTLHQNPWGNTSKHVTSNLLQRDGCHSYSYGSLQGLQGLSAFAFLPDANLISRAVRIRAISVEVKCTVLSSAMGMFIFTKRW